MRGFIAHTHRDAPQVQVLFFFLFSFLFLFPRFAGLAAAGLSVKAVVAEGPKLLASQRFSCFYSAPVVCWNYIVWPLVWVVGVVSGIQQACYEKANKYAE
jgi:hypothetical protein